ncbi:MAG TPA: hypothetical protein VH251_10445, partial [Verrucomicrobiae bacterium]|nr:hypothetical protein [Verrucomicrobiae bacterium]
PLRWELKPAQGGRPLVLLRVLPDAAPQPASQTKPEETHRMVFFVGNLISDDKSGGMTMNQLVDAIQKAWPEDLGKAAGVIQFHAEAQLLVANGTREQNDFIQQMLSALRQKAQWDSFKQDSAGPASKTNDSKNDLKPGGKGAK